MSVTSSGLTQMLGAVTLVGSPFRRRIVTPEADEPLVVVDEVGETAMEADLDRAGEPQVLADELDREPSGAGVRAAALTASPRSRAPRGRSQRRHRTNRRPARRGPTGASPLRARPRPHRPQHRSWRRRWRLAGPSHRPGSSVTARPGQGCRTCCPEGRPEPPASRLLLRPPNGGPAKHSTRSARAVASLPPARPGPARPSIPGSQSAQADLAVDWAGSPAQVDPGIGAAR